MPIDPSVSLNAKPVDGMSQLKDLLGVASGAQQYQSNQLALTRARALLNPEIEQGKAASRSAVAAANVAEGTQGAKISQENTAASSASYKLNSEQSADALQLAGGLLQSQSVQDASNPDKMADPATAAKVRESLMDDLGSVEDRMRAKGIPDKTIRANMAHFYVIAQDHPDKMRDALAAVVRGGIAPAGQPGAGAPSGISITNGQQSSTVNTNAAAGPIGAPVPGTTVQQQLPPTTPVYDAGKGGMTYYGAQGQGGPAAAAPLGTPENVSGTVDVVNKDYQETAAAAAKAKQDIALLENIKMHAKGAVTGVGAERRALVQGLLGLGGFQGGEDEKSNYDMLQKNSNILAGQGGNTDAARNLAEASNPNSHMTIEAINESADQLKASRQMSLYKQNYLAPFKNNPEAYTDHLRLWNKYADPRVIQYMNADEAGKTKMLRGMGSKEAEKFKTAGRFMESIGGGQ